MMTLILPMIILIILLLGLKHRTGLMEAFAEGAKEGLAAALKVLPALVAMLAAIELFTVSGAMEYLIRTLMPLAKAMRVPESIWPIALVRPLSGSAATGMLADLFSTYGPDSMEGWIGATLIGSTETILYTLAIYLGSVKIKRGRYALVAALFAGACGLIASVVVCGLLYPY